MEQRSHFSCLVDEHGQVFEWDDKEGCDVLAQDNRLICYAQALLFSQQEKVAFYYTLQSEIQAVKNNYFFAKLSRHQQRFTLLQLERCELPFELSLRELETLTLLSDGLSNKEIAELLFISERTVAKHVENLLQKTDIDNRTALAVFAITYHLCLLPLPAKLEHSMLVCFELEKITQNQPIQAVKNKKNFVNPVAIATSKSRPIVIGVPYVQHGIGEIDTKELLNGSRLAVEVINRRGGIHGRKIEITTAGFCVKDESSIVDAYHQLFDQEVDAISTSYACYTPEIHALVAEKGVPYLHIATHSQSDKLAQHLPTNKIDNMFQVCASDVNYGSGVLRFMQFYQQNYLNLLQNRCILLITVKWQKIDIGIEKLIQEAKKLAWKVEILELEQADNAFAYAMQQVHYFSPSIIVLASYFAEDIVGFHKAFLQQPSNAIIYSIYAPSTFSSLEQPCEGVIWSTTCGLANNFAGQQFATLYQQFFSREPTYSQASIAFDQINILANAWQHSLSPRAFKDVSNGIRSLPYHGVNGTYYFGTEAQTGLAYPDNTRDLSISLPHLVYQIQQGESKVIAPELFSERDFSLPKWFKFK